MQIIEQIGAMDLWYVPVALMIVLVVIGVSLGAVNGAKVATYFFIWNLIALVVAVFTGSMILDKFLMFKIQELLGEGEIGKIILDNSKHLTGIIILALLLALVLVVNLIALIFYLPFRKKFKRAIKKNQENNKSNGWSRFFGAGLGVLSVVPIAASTVGLSVVVSKKEPINDAVSKFVNIASFGKINDISEKIRGIFVLIDAKNFIQDFIKIIGSTDFDQFTEKTPENKEKNTEFISKILGSDMTKDVVVFLAEQFNVNTEETTKNIAGNEDKITEAILKQINPVDLDAKQKESLETLISTMAGDTAEEQAAIDKIIAGISAK